MSQYKLRTKALVFDEMLNRQKGLVYAVEDSLEAIAENANINEGAGFRGDAEARREEMIETFEAIKPHYKQNQRDLQTLENMVVRLDIIEFVAPGAIIMTDSLNFVVGISMLPFEVEGKKYIGISTKAPIYVLLAGKHIGEVVHNGRQTYLIEDIF